MPKKAKGGLRTFGPYVGAGVVLLAFFLAWGPIMDWYYRTPPERNDPVLAQIDPICQFVERLGLRCLSSPSAESLMGPGRYVRYTPTEGGAKVQPLGSGSLFESVCIVDGVEPGKAVQVLTEALEKQQSTDRVPFDEVRYKLDRAFQAGASLPVPEACESGVEGRSKAERGSGDFDGRSRLSRWLCRHAGRRAQRRLEVPADGHPPPAGRGRA